MSDNETKIIFGNPFQGGERTYGDPYELQDEDISSTTSSESLDEFNSDWDFWERHKALQAKARNRRSSVRKYRRLARRLVDERREKTRELFHMIARNKELTEHLKALQERFNALVYEKLHVERRYYNAQAALDEIRGVEKRKVWKSLPVDAEVDGESACVVCLQGKRTIAFVPCGGQGRAFPLSHLQGAL